MIATFLQDDLADELEKIFQHFLLTNINGDRVNINVYKQFLPILEAESIPDTVTDEELEEGIYDAEPATKVFPYILVRVTEGKIETIGGDQTVIVNLLIGTIDRSSNNQGYKDILNIMQKIYERFSKNAILNCRYECLMPISWAMQEEESFPYFFGGMALTFATSPITREDPYT